MKKILSRILNAVKNTRNIYIFGAGTYGKIICNALLDNKIKPTAYIVTTGQECVQDGVPIINIKKIIDKFQCDDIIIMGMNIIHREQVLTDFPQLLKFRLLTLSQGESYCLRYNSLIKNIKRLSSIYPVERKIVLRKFKRILVIRLDVIGDFIVTTAFLRELRRNFPVSEITLVVRDEIVPFANNCPYVDEVLGINNPVSDFACSDYEALYDKSINFAQEYFQDKIFDAVFLPRECGDNFIALLLAIVSGAKVRLGRREVMTETGGVIADMFEPMFSQLVRHKLPEHEAKRNLQLLESIGIRCSQTNLELWISKADMSLAEEFLRRFTDFRIAIGMVSRDQNRTWDKENYYLLLNTLYAVYGEKVGFILLGGADARETADYVMSADGCILNLVEKTSLPLACAVISQCDIYLGANTGLLHMASACGKKVIEISAHLKHGDPNDDIAPQRFGAWQVPCITLYPEHGLDSECENAGRCKKKYAHCINQVQVADVVNAVNEFIIFSSGETLLIK